LFLVGRAVFTGVLVFRSRRLSGILRNLYGSDEGYGLETSENGKM